MMTQSGGASISSLVEITQWDSCTRCRCAPCLEAPHHASASLLFLQRLAVNLPASPSLDMLTVIRP